MESLSNQNMYGKSNSSGSNVELTLFGIDKKWVRSNGSWRDKSKLRVVTKSDHSVLETTEIVSSSKHWWQFWKA